MIVTLCWIVLVLGVCGLALDIVALVHSLRREAEGRRLERKAGELEREFVGSFAAGLAKIKADQMRRKARMLK